MERGKSGPFGQLGHVHACAGRPRLGPERELGHARGLGRGKARVGAGPSGVDGPGGQAGLQEGGRKERRKGDSAQEDRKEFSIFD